MINIVIVVAVIGWLVAALEATCIYRARCVVADLQLRVSAGREAVDVLQAALDKEKRIRREEEESFVRRQAEVRQSAKDEARRNRARFAEQIDAHIRGLSGITKTLRGEEF